MKYLLTGAALLVLVAAGPAWANNVFDCQDVGTSAPEPIGDAEGHALLTDTFSCRLTAGPMAGGLLTGTIAWEMNKGEGTLISGTGVIRKPGSLVVYKDTEGTFKLTMDDTGHVTGFTGSGAATWVFASGDAAALKGKVLPWTAKATGPGTFSVDEKTD